VYLGVHADPIGLVPSLYLENRERPQVKQSIPVAQATKESHVQGVTFGKGIDQSDSTNGASA
jgi:hypothetical protein